MNKQNLINHLIQFGKTDENSWEDLAKQFHLSSGESARNMWFKYRKSNKFKQEISAEAANYIGELEEIIESKINYEKGEANIKFNNKQEALSDDEIYKECKLDSKKWKLSLLWQKKQQNGMFTYSASFKPIDTNSPVLLEETFSEILKTYKSPHLPLIDKEIKINTTFSSPKCCFIALTDVHLDKQTVDGQSLDFKIKQYLSVLDALLYKAYISNNIEEIVFTVGHDLFNSDTYFSTTTNGTQQVNNSQWNDSYEEIFNSQVVAINKCKQFCKKLYIKHIPSNHARMKEYFLVHALDIYFKEDDNIIFDRNAESSKVHIYGENFIGMHHGDVKLDKLPLYFSQKFYKEWGTAKYKSLMVGDKHSRKSWNTSSTEIDGVRIYQTPHMGGYGAWDKSMLFDNGIQSGIAMIFDATKGRCAELEEII